MSFEKTAANKIYNLEKSADRSRTQDNYDNIASGFSMFNSIFGLVGFWPFNSVDANLAYDLSGQGRNLTKNGTPSTSELSSGMAYYTLNGTTQYLSRADEAALDITSNLTFGLWCYPTSLAVTVYAMSKATAAGNQRSYYLSISNTGQAAVNVYVDGSTATTSPGAAAEISVNNWYFLVGRYIPSTELSLFVNGTEYLNTTAIPASLYNGSAPLIVGGVNAGASFVGRVAFPFLCQKALQDSDISRLFSSTRTLFGV